MPGQIVILLNNIIIYGYIINYDELVLHEFKTFTQRDLLLIERGIY